MAFTSRWTVFDSQALQDNALNRHTCGDRRAAGQARRDLAPTTAPCWPAKSVRSPRAGPSRATYPFGRDCSRSRLATRSYELGAVGRLLELTQLTTRRRVAWPPDRAMSSMLRPTRRLKKHTVGDDVDDLARPDCGPAASPTSSRPGQRRRWVRSSRMDVRRPAMSKAMYSNPGYGDNHPEHPRRARSVVLQPCDAGALPAGLDVQGRDHCRRARHRQVHAQPIINGRNPQ